MVWLLIAQISQQQDEYRSEMKWSVADVGGKPPNGGEPTQPTGLGLRWDSNQGPQW